MYKFKTEPYQHQRDALKKCWNKESFAIFAEMGTGKTKIALDNACILYKAQLKDIISLDDYSLKIMVMNVEAFSSKKGLDFAKLFLIGKSMVIVDESTTIKNPQAKRTKSLLLLSKEAKYRRIMTGSPVTQSPRSRDPRAV